MKNPKPEHKDCVASEFKFALSETDSNLGAFSGYASKFGVIDSYNDMVMPGAFKKTLREKEGIVPLLWSHDVATPIGLVRAKEDKTGLKIEGELNLDVVKSNEIRSLMKQGVVKGLSIGYQTVKEGIDELSGARQLKEVALWEVSAVVFPALSVAQVTDVKAESVDDDEPITLEPLVVPDLAPTPEPISEPVTDHSLDYAEVVREFRKSIERGTNA
jgi:uncharacterized protein